MTDTQADIAVTDDASRDQKNKKTARLKRERYDAVFKRLLETADFRFWLWTRLESAGVFQAVFHHDPATMAFNEGRRNAGLELLEQALKQNPALFTLMITENSGEKYV